MEPLRPAAAPADPKEALERKRRRDAVRGFEEMFVAQLLKSMRKTVPVDGEQAAKTLWQERSDEELARRIAESGGIGLAPLVEKGMAPPGRRR